MKKILQTLDFLQRQEEIQYLEGIILGIIFGIIII